MEFGGHIGQLIIGAFYSYMYESELKNKRLIEALSNIHDKYIMVPVDKAANNIALICKKRYIDCVKIEFG